MIDAAEFTKRLFIWGVLAVTVVPRQHIDRTSWTIGGSLSHSFRYLLSACVALNLVRLACKLLLGRQLRWITDILGIVQIVSLSFICFLTPYILQTWLARRINVGGRPGASLMPPLYLTAILSVAGVFFARTVHPNLWALNRLANVVTGPPVLRTLKMYSSVTSVGGHHNGRGSVLTQTLVVVEYWHMITQFICAIGFALMDRSKSVDEYTQFDMVLQGCRDIAFISGWTRVCAHGIFMNMLDELYLTSPSADGSTTNQGASDVNGEDTQDITEIVPLSQKASA